MSTHARTLIHGFLFHEPQDGSTFLFGDETPGNGNQVYVFRYNGSNWIQEKMFQMNSYNPNPDNCDISDDGKIQIY